MRTSALISAKTHGVSERTKGKGFEPDGHISDKEGEGSIFRDFVRTSFMDGSLGNVQTSYNGFLSNFRLPPPYDGIPDVFSRPFPPYDVFNQPFPHIYRK